MSMNADKTEINDLITDTETKFGKKLFAPADFEEFSRHLNATKGINLSVSTLKRLWGYVSYSHKPRLSTLNALARYNGYVDFMQYCAYKRSDSDNSSSFFTTSQVFATDLHTGQALEIEWAPNRYLLLRHLDGIRFRVEVSQNSKLAEGDEFDSTMFELGQRLYLPFVLRCGEKLASFIAGKNGGLTFINIPDDDE